ncbi:MAG: hypothetical protein H6Q89_2164 [Myxococcaceae bacterium]|nr:hypothetical protein [Myxococcaceae bacterium]
MELALVFIFLLTTLVMVGGLLRQSAELNEARERAARRLQLATRLSRPPARGAPSPGRRRLPALVKTTAHRS